MAQLELFEDYFKDLGHFGVSQKGQVYDDGYTNPKKLLRERIDIFSKRVELTPADYSVDTGRIKIPSDVFKFNTLYVGGRKVDEISKDMSQFVMNSPLTAPVEQNPKFEKLENQIELYPASLITTTGTGTDDDPFVTTFSKKIELSYVRTPTDPKWGYVNPGSSVIADIYPDLANLDIPTSPLYNPNTSQDFELHVAETPALIKQILMLAGVAIKQADIVELTSRSIQSDEVKNKS